MVSPTAVSLCHVWLHGPFFLRSGVAHVDNVITSQSSKQSQGCSCQGCRAGAFWNLRNPAPGTYTNTRRNSPEPSGTYTNTRRNLPPKPTPAHTGTLRNLPELVSGTYTTTRRNFPEFSGICLRNLYTNTHAGTLRNLPEPSSGTCSCDPHRHTPELLWAEDPISSRCWGITTARPFYKSQFSFRIVLAQRLGAGPFLCRPCRFRRPFSLSLCP